MRFFFYGTLMADSRNSAAHALHAKLRPLGPAKTQGRLFAIPDPLGWYPVLLPGDGMVTGRLYEAMANFDETDLAGIDAYEDFYPGNPADSLYLRKTIQIACDDGQNAEAQAYLFNQPLPSEAKPIPNGDFRAWIAEHGLTTFCTTQEGQ